VGFGGGPILMMSACETLVGRQGLNQQPPLSYNNSSRTKAKFAVEETYSEAAYCRLRWFVIFHNHQLLRKSGTLFALSHCQ
jgi:hypothetical protein